MKSKKNFRSFIRVQADLPPISTFIPYEDYCVVLKLSSISVWPLRPPLLQIRILPEFVATLPLTHRQLHTPASWGREFVCHLVPFARNFILKLNYLQIVYICGKMRHIGTIRLFYFLLHFIDVFVPFPLPPFTFFVSSHELYGVGMMDIVHFSVLLCFTPSLSRVERIYT